MAPDHLAGDDIGHVVERKRSHLRGELCVVDDL
jgi:hypothetical protein